MKNAAKHFEREFEKQLLLSERFRALLLALVFACLGQLAKLHSLPILISEEVFEKIDHFSDVFESIGEVEIKGRKKPIHIFKIKDKL